MSNMSFQQGIAGSSTTSTGTPVHRQMQRISLKSPPWQQQQQHHQQQQHSSGRMRYTRRRTRGSASPMHQSPTTTTSTTSTSSTPSSTSSTTSSSSSQSWKEALRRECLERAKRKRGELLARARSRGIPSTSCTTVGTTPPRMDHDGAARLDFDADADMLDTPVRTTSDAFSTMIVSANQEAKRQVQEELLAAATSASSISSSMAQPLQARYSLVTEEEVYDVMAQVEEELRKEEAWLLAELQEEERRKTREDAEVAAQVAEYESWIGQQHQQQEATASSAVRIPTEDEDDDFAMEEAQHGQSLHTSITTNPGTCSNGVVAPNEENCMCPICGQAQLIRTPAGVIVCPNYNHQQPAATATVTNPALKRPCTISTNNNHNSCSLRLDVHGEGLSLRHLRERLLDVYERHGYACAKQGRLYFEVCQAPFMEEGVQTLNAGCCACGWREVVL